MATKAGCVEALEWAVAQGYAWAGYREVMCAHAARHSQPEVLRWARKRGCPLTPFDTCTVTAAPRGGEGKGDGSRQTRTSCNE